jgi:hypothetical protein
MLRLYSSVNRSLLYFQLPTNRPWRNDHSLRQITTHGVPADLPRVKCKPLKVDDCVNVKIGNYAAPCPQPAEDSGILARDFDLITDHLLSAHVIILLCSFTTFDFSFIKTYEPALLVDPWNVLYLMYLSQNSNSTELFRRWYL